MRRPPPACIHFAAGYSRPMTAQIGIIARASVEREGPNQRRDEDYALLEIPRSADNCNRQSPARKRFNGLPIPVGEGKSNTMILQCGSGGPGHLGHLQTDYCLCPRRLNAASPSKKKRRLGMIRGLFSRLSKSLVRYQNKPDNSLPEPKSGNAPLPRNQKSSYNLFNLAVSWPVGVCS
ncbi:hypothetical protein JTE90_015699 [Oedothorax gibbosus]|uniref:Uncharacterized protein n=1 Tax=Oedothorax gibbosus TaxID=931172 RepID=A0AAV6TGK6_9ARAC|nr:hypothetical protein JTE90_015699 [Oedothorax gibbosus]